MTDRGEERKREPVLCGVSLGQYGAVQAALAEGLDRDAALAREGVSVATWEAAEGAWALRLVDDAAREGLLQAAFDARFLDAQERYGRRISPLDDDLSAWLAFVRHWSRDPEPLGLLARLGMQPSDVVRLHKAWSRRLARDPVLRRRAQGLLQSEPPELPAVEVQPAKLPPPAPDARASSAEGSGQPPIVDEALEEERAPALFAALPHEEADRGAGVEGLPAQAAADPAETEGEALPAAAQPAVVVPSYALPGPTGTVPLPPFTAGSALPFTATGAPVLEPKQHLAGPRPEHRTDTVALFGPAPPAQIALGPLANASASPWVSASAANRETAPAAVGAPKDGRKGILSLEDYAALCAEVAVFPEAAEAAFARCGLGLPQKRASTDLRWQGRLRRNPIEHEEWSRLYLHFHALFTEEARRKKSSPAEEP